MSLNGLEWLGFALAIVCVLAGLALTGQRVGTPPPVKKPVSPIRPVLLARGAQKDELCSRCAQELEPGARFCGGCGLALKSQRGPYKAARRM